MLLLIYSWLCIKTWQGVITKDVVNLRRSIGAPGMAVLQFGKKAPLCLFVTVVSVG